MGMRIEKAMIFGGKHEDIQHLPFQCNNYDGDRILLGKSSYLTATSSSRLKLNSSFRCHEPNSGHNNANTTCTTHLKGKESRTKDSDTFYQQQQQQQQHHHQHNLQSPAQRLYQHHYNFQNYNHQHQIILREDEGQRESEHHLPYHHQQHYNHQQQQEQHCCGK